MAASAPVEAGIRVRLFAALRETAGWGERLIAATTPCAGTPLALWQQLGLEPRCQGPDIPPGGIRAAINKQFASWDTPLAAGDELAFLPPISGG
ncbi:MAG: MoaD/ThiS family protein [Cyanobacteria bacterium M_surface_10_m2_119]|nr:MoaD/ThiS family protein [Cyanobacteria bacterium M_surface_10_m2_119]